MENAERLQHQVASQQQQHERLATEPLAIEEPQQQQQPTAEQIIASSGLPERARDWLRKYPDYVTDPTKNAQIQKMHHVAEYQAGGEFSDLYFERMERLLGLKPETNGNGAQQPVRPAVQRQAAPVRQQRAAGGPIMSAPPTRDVPSMTTGRPANMRVPLTADELYIAQQSKQTPEEYQQQKEKMLRLKAAGAIQDGR
jgi:hypothetical protein